VFAGWESQSLQVRRDRLETTAKETRAERAESRSSRCRGEEFTRQGGFNYLTVLPLAIDASARSDAQRLTAVNPPKTCSAFIDR